MQNQPLDVARESIADDSGMSDSDLAESISDFQIDGSPKQKVSNQIEPTGILLGTKNLIDQITSSASHTLEASAEFGGKVKAAQNRYHGEDGADNAQMEKAQEDDSDDEGNYHTASID